MKKNILSFINSTVFPEIFIATVFFFVLINLLAVLSVTTAYNFCWEHRMYNISKELLLSSAGTASIGIGGYYCFCRQRKIMNKKI